MPLSLASRCSGSCAHSSSSLHNKADAKGFLGALRCAARAAGPAVLLFGTNSTGWNSQRHSALPHSHRDSPAGASAASTAAADTVSASAAAPAPLDPDEEAVKLMTAAAILSSSASSDPADDVTSSYDDSSSLSDSLTAGSQVDVDDFGPLSVLTEINTVDADSLALAIGILRQRQPLDADEDGVQLSERLRDFLMVLRRRPLSTAAGNPSTHTSSSGSAHADSGPTAAAVAAPGDGLQAPAAAEAAEADEGFWAGKDEWADVRGVLMGIGINASLDEEDDEDVWALEAGRVKTRRTRLLRSLPRLDSSTAQQLTAFLAEVQQHSSTDTHPSTHSTGSSAAASTQAAGAAGQGVQEAVSAEEEEWWQQAALAYNLLRQQAGKVQEVQDAQTDSAQ